MPAYPTRCSGSIRGRGPPFSGSQHENVPYDCYLAKLYCSLFHKPFKHDRLPVIQITRGKVEMPYPKGVDDIT